MTITTAKTSSIIKISIVSLLLLFGFGIGLNKQIAFADNGIPPGCPGSDQMGPPAPGSCDQSPNFGLPTEKPEPCDGSGGADKLQKCLEENPIIFFIQAVINFLAVGVGVVTVAMIVIGGIQYSAAGGNPAGVQEAKKKIANALIALLSFLFLYAGIQWLVPGGVF